MSNSINDLGFRSGFFISNETPEEIFSAPRPFQPDFVVLRAAVPSGKIARPVSEVSPAVTEKPKGFWRKIAQAFEATSTYETSTEAGKPGTMPGSEISESNDITKTKKLYNIADFKIPFIQKENGHLALDRSRPPIVAKVRGDVSFSEALFQVMVFANPKLTSAFNQEELPRVVEGDNDFMSCLTAVDLKTSGQAMIDFSRLRPVEDFLDHYKIGFSALDPVIRNRVDLNALNGSTSLVTLPHSHCREAAPLDCPYKFQRIETPLVVINPQFATVAANARPVMTRGNDNALTAKQNFALQCLRYLEISKESLEQNGFQMEFDVRNFSDSALSFNIEMTGPFGEVKQVLRMSSEHGMSSNPDGSRPTFKIIFAVKGDKGNISHHGSHTLQGYDRDTHWASKELTRLLQTSYDDSIFAEKLKSVSTRKLAPALEGPVPE